MAFDDHVNFGYSLVAVAPAPAASGTSLEVVAGTGVLFPVAPFNCTVWPSATSPSASTAEIIRVTNKVGDVFTIIRAQESTAARTIVIGDQIANTATDKVFTDIENAITGLTPIFGVIDPNGAVAGSIGQFYKDTNTGLLYINSDGTNTGWI
mgnify:CR=1 FL=1